MSDLDDPKVDPEADKPTDETPDEPLREPGIKALHAEREAREQAEKNLKILQDRLDAIDAEKLSETEKAQKAAEDAESARQTAEAETAKAKAEAIRWRIAAKHGISDDDAELFLTGTDEDTLTRQAERLAARGTPSKGTHVPGAGNHPGTPPSLDAQIAAAESEGDAPSIMRLKAQKLAELAQTNK